MPESMMPRLQAADVPLEDAASLEQLVRAWRLLLRASGEPNVAKQASAAGVVAWVLLRESGIDPQGFMRRLDQVQPGGRAH